MLKPLSILALAGFFTLSPITAKADIFLGSDNNSGASGGSIFLDRSPTPSRTTGSNKSVGSDRPIFVSPNKGSSRTLPSYAITNTDTSKKDVIGFGNAAERLQAAKLREARVKERYRDNRKENINLQTLPEEFARKFKGTTLSDLTDYSAYQAALSAESQAKQALNENNLGTGTNSDGPIGGFGDLAAETMQKSSQLAASAQSQSDKVNQKQQQKSGGVVNPNGVYQGRNGRTYIP